MKFNVGDKVYKPAGYRFVGEVLAAFVVPNRFPNMGGERYVVINSDGLMHIFNPGQLEHRVEPAPEYKL